MNSTSQSPMSQSVASHFRIFAAAMLTACSTYAADLPNWAIGPFTRPADAQPVIKPNPASSFECPLAGTNVNWEKLHTFNPAAVVKDGKICVLYRAEDQSGVMRVGGHTSRVGLAASEDGIHFTRQAAPVLFPANDDQKEIEWTGGCEDPRVAQGPDGTFVVTYTQYNGRGHFELGLAVSKDLVHWTKKGSPFSGTKYNHLSIKSASVVHQVIDGKFVAAKINGKYWMYFGEEAVYVATSDDLASWKPVENAEGKMLQIMATRPKYFDSALTEVGPQPMLTKDGIVLFYNGKNKDPKIDGDPELSNGVYTCGQALFSKEDPTKLISRLDKPFFKPELAWEKSGQYAAGTTFSEGLALYKGKWFLYYGCADTFVGVAMAEAGK